MDCVVDESCVDGTNRSGMLLMFWLSRRVGEGEQRYGPALAPARLGSTSEPKRPTLSKEGEENRQRSKRATTSFRQTMLTDRRIEEEDERNMDIPWQNGQMLWSWGSSSF